MEVDVHLVVVILMLGGMILIRQFPALATTLLDWASRPRTGPAGLGAAVGLLAVSAACSIRLYRRRSL